MYLHVCRILFVCAYIERYFLNLFKEYLIRKMIVSDDDAESNKGNFTKKSNSWALIAISRITFFIMIHGKFFRFSGYFSVLIHNFWYELF